MQTFRPKRKYLKGRGRLRTEAIVGYFFFLVILAGGPVISMIAMGSLGKGRAGKVDDLLFGEGGMLVYLAAHPTQFAVFCFIGAAVLTTLYILYQSLATVLLAFSFDEDAKMFFVELAKPYKSESLQVAIPYNELKFWIEQKDIGQVNGIVKYKPVVTITINDDGHKICTGHGPWEETDRNTIDELVALLNSIKK